LFTLLSIGEVLLRFFPHGLGVAPCAFAFCGCLATGELNQQQGDEASGEQQNDDQRLSHVYSSLILRGFALSVVIVPDIGMFEVPYKRCRHLKGIPPATNRPHQPPRSYLRCTICHRSPPPLSKRFGGCTFHLIADVFKGGRDVLGFESLAAEFIRDGPARVPPFAMPRPGDHGSESGIIDKPHLAIA
jgi:hypothetical protein